VRASDLLGFKSSMTPPAPAPATIIGAFDPKSNTFARSDGSEGAYEEQSGTIIAQPNSDTTCLRHPCRRALGGPRRDGNASSALR
jgi:hypothetical protein